LEQAEAEERGHAVVGDLGDYPAELLQVRLQTLQEWLSSHYPPTYIYITSLVMILVAAVALIATGLGLHVADGKPWVLGVIVVVIAIFISKMVFLSRIEKVYHTPSGIDGIVVVVFRPAGWQEWDSILT
jgi:hypothetical protein